MKRNSTWLPAIIIGLILQGACKKDTVHGTDEKPDTPIVDNPDTPVVTTARPLMVAYWGGCCYDRNDVGPLEAIPDSVDVVNIFTLGIGLTATGSWEFEHRGVSGYNDWNQVLINAQNLRKKGIKIVCTSFPGSLVGLTAAQAATMASVVKDSLDKWQFDGVDLDLEYGNVRSRNIDSAVIALGKYLGPDSKTGRILSVVDYNNYNINQITRSKKYIDYVMTMSYWNTAVQVTNIAKSYGNAIGDTKKVLIGVGQGCAINAGQATPPGEELKIADTLRTNLPGTGMMEFIFGCSYHNNKDISYTQNIIRHLKR